MRKILAALLTAAPLALAAAELTDHPLLPRYPGADLRYADDKEYEEAQIVLSRPVSKGSKLVVEKLLPLEGKVSYRMYELPKTVSPLQAFRNYQAGLKRGGFQELFVCDRPCGDAHFGEWKELFKQRRAYLNGSSDDLFYLAAQRDNVYVALAVNMVSSTPSVFAFIVEKTALDDTKISITGNSPIAQGLAKAGRVDVYGFLFDTGKSQLKPDSAATLRDLAQVLKDNPKLAVDVVGHTDDVGTPDANQALSLGRAQAVSAALTTEHGIDPHRLSAQGKGATQPVAPNKTEDGRARNRRVEIVARGAAPAPAPTPVAQAEAPAEPASAAQTAEKSSKLKDAAKKLKDIFAR